MKGETFKIDDSVGLRRVVFTDEESCDLCEIAQFVPSDSGDGYYHQEVLIGKVVNVTPVQNSKIIRAKYEKNGQILFWDTSADSPNLKKL